MYCLKYGCLYWGHVQMFCRLGIICIAERLTLIQDGNFVANTWSQRTSSVWNVLLHKMYGQQRGKLQKCSNDAQDIFMLFRWLMDKLSQQELERWAVTVWAIWNAQNKYHFEHIQIQPKSILDGALGFLREYQRLIATQTSNWMCFDSAMLILNGMFLFYTTCCMATALYICIFTGFKPVLPSPWV